MTIERYFLLSPAFLGGRRGSWLRNPDAVHPLARDVSTTGAPIAEVYAFISALYFRGKITYARRFSSSSDAVRVITPTRGLVDEDFLVTRSELEEFAAVDIQMRPEAYLRALRDTLEPLAIGDADFVLLGSVATGKYGDLLSEVLGQRLLFPREFVGRGDMSRGGLLLRAAAAGTELEYTSFMQTVRRGPRPPRLPKT
jgi:hypothetical protein